MKESLKYTPGNFYFNSQLKFPEYGVFWAPGLLDILFKMTGSLKYKTGFSCFSSQLKFPEEAV